MTYKVIYVKVIYGACHRDSVPQGNLVSTNQKHEPDLRRSTLSVWYGISAFVSRGNQWWYSRNVRCFLRLHILQIILCYDTISDQRDGGAGGLSCRPNLPIQWIVKLQNKQILMPTRWPGNGPLNCFFFDARKSFRSEEGILSFFVYTPIQS